MKIIPTKDLQNLANMLYQEESVSLRSQLSAWVNSKASNPDHAPLSSLSAMAEQSTIKDKINEWVSNITTPKPEFIYVPDVPAQIEEPTETEKFNDESEFIPHQEGDTYPEELLPEVIDNEKEPEPEIVKPKKPRKKKPRKKKVD